MYYQKRAALLVLSIVCYLLAAATVALGDRPAPGQKTPPQSDGSPVLMGDDGNLAQTADGSSDLSVETDDYSELQKTSSGESAPADSMREQASRPDETQPGLISRILSQTKGLVKRAISWLGTRYKWGGISKKGVDCSGLTRLLYMKEGISLPHSAKQQFKLGFAVNRVSLLPGDLVFFNTRGPITHVGMYIGNGEFIHAANPTRGVRIDSLGSVYYDKRYAGARRYKNFG